MATSPCPLHQWNQPCYTCAQATRHLDDWLARLWRSGHMPTSLQTRKTFQLHRQDRALVTGVPDGA